MAIKWQWDGQFPHCDQRIVHKKGECVYCDEHAGLLQYIRQMWNINFTGHHDVETPEGTGMLPCPAEVARPISIINKWGGNVAKTREILEQEEEAMETALNHVHKLITSKEGK